MSLGGDVEHFLERHRPHGRLEPTVGPETPNGYRPAIASPVA
jgi:hypothetical protein